MFSKKNKAPRASSKTAVDYAPPQDQYYNNHVSYQEPAPEPVPMATAAPSVEYDFNSNEAILQAQGAALHNHNRDLVKRLTELKDKRDELDNAINAEEEEKYKYEQHLLALQQRLQEVNEGLVKKNNVKAEVERVIDETESAYSKLVESSHSLLGLLERETLNIQKERKTEAEILM